MHGLWRFKDLSRRTASDKVLRNKAFNIAKNLITSVFGLNKRITYGNY